MDPEGRTGGISRRVLMRSGALAAAGVALGRLFQSRGEARAGRTCAATPVQTSGPFYPSEDQPDEDLDLTRVHGQDGTAQGEVILVRGRVLDDECRPIADALVEIWQANTHGRYHHERDTSPAPVDPSFQGWGEVVTNSRGEYGFKTVLPGPYGAGSGRRTRHIHFRIARRGYRELVTQMYFEGEPLNEQDFLWNELTPEERTRVTVKKEAVVGPEGDEACLCRFDLVMPKL